MKRKWSAPVFVDDRDEEQPHDPPERRPNINLVDEIDEYQSPPPPKKRRAPTKLVLPGSTPKKTPAKRKTETPVDAVPIPEGATLTKKRRGGGRRKQGPAPAPVSIVHRIKRGPIVDVCSVDIGSTYIAAVLLDGETGQMTAASLGNLKWDRPDDTNRAYAVTLDRWVRNNMHIFSAPLWVVECQFSEPGEEKIEKGPEMPLIEMMLHSLAAQLGKEIEAVLPMHVKTLLGLSANGHDQNKIDSVNCIYPQMTPAEQTIMWTEVAHRVALNKVHGCYDPPREHDIIEALANGKIVLGIRTERQFLKIVEQRKEEDVTRIHAGGNELIFD